MDNDDKSFKDNLDLLIKLFKKLKERTPIQEIPGIDKNMYQNFDLFLKNYEMMKDQISEDLLMNFGEPMKKMISDLIQQLKSELGEEEVANIQNETKVQTDEYKDLRRDIAQIDELLKNPNLSEEEINNLLDERAGIQQNNNPEINN